MNVFNRDMALKQLSGRSGVLSIPEGVTELTYDFALVFDWEQEGRQPSTLRELKISSTVQTINGIYLSSYSPDQSPVGQFKKITVSELNPYFKAVDGVLFSKDGTRLICYPCGKIGDTYEVPDTVITIGESAFENNRHLRKINLPGSVKRIEERAFSGCEKLSDINLPYGLEYIGEECFMFSALINRLNIPLSVQKLYTSIFWDGGIISIPHTKIELEYDYVPTDYVCAPFDGPAIISSGNDELVDFAESYYYNHFEDCFEDNEGIIWADQGKTLICFPSEWTSDVYELPEQVQNVYRNAFLGTRINRIFSSHEVTIVGKTENKYEEPIKGREFHVPSWRLYT